MPRGLFFGCVPELRAKFRRDLDLDILRLRAIDFYLVCEGTQFAHSPGVLRQYLWRCIQIDEGAISINTALQRCDGAAHQRRQEEERQRFHYHKPFLRLI